MSNTSVRRATLALAALAVTALAVTTAAPAQAHSYLVESTPAEGSIVTELPDAFSVTTNEKLLDLTGGADGFALQVVDASGLYYGDGCLSVSDATLSTGATLGQSGDYRLIWQVVSEDGHPVSGELAFTWQPADAAQTSAGSATPPVCGEAVPTPTATATAEPQPTATATPIAVEEHADADLGGVVLIGGIIAAVLGAAVATVLLLGRRARKTSA